MSDLNNRVAPHGPVKEMVTLNQSDSKSNKFLDDSRNENEN